MSFPAAAQEMSPSNPGLELAKRLVFDRDQYLTNPDLIFEDIEHCQIIAAVLGKMDIPCRKMARMITFQGSPNQGRVLQAIVLKDGEDRLFMGPHGAVGEDEIAKELSATLFPGQPVQPYEFHGGWSASGGLFLDPRAPVTRFILNAIENGAAFLLAHELRADTPQAQGRRPGPRL